MHLYGDDPERKAEAERIYRDTFPAPTARSITTDALIRAAIEDRDAGIHEVIDHFADVEWPMLAHECQAIYVAWLES